MIDERMIDPKSVEIKEQSVKLETKYSPNNDLKDSRTKLTDVGRIQISRKAWIVRMIIVATIAFFPLYRLLQGASLADPFIIYSTIIPTVTVLVLFGAWFWYRNPPEGTVSKNDLVSIIIPIYNERDMIEMVIDAVYRSTYKNIEVIAINDGSIDGTNEILDNIRDKYPSLKVIHQARGGKRNAVATGYYASKGRYLVHIDSDSIIDEAAITEMVRTFNANPNIGIVVGEIRIGNANDSTLTKIQEAWHNISCNINKAYESVFGSVTCCSGSLSAHRREAIQDFMPYWAASKSFSGGGVDRELNAFVIAPDALKEDYLKTLWPSSQTRQQLMESTARYDDSDDRMLTAHSLIRWQAAYIVTALTYVKGQETWSRFIKQQIRWRKGFLRTNFYLSTFYWQKRHPLAVLVYYLDVMAALTAPFAISTVLIYETLILNQYWLALAFIGGIVYSALAMGIDMKLRYPKSKIWKYMPLMSLLGTFVLSWLTFVAIKDYKKNSWMTR
jgi:hyaluronan synthase